MRIQKLPPEYSKQADKYLDSLDQKTEQRLKDGIERIPQGDIIPYKALVGPDDLYYIELAEQEYARGETISHNDRKWK